MKAEIAVLIAGIGGALIGILGQIVANKIEHKNKINYMKIKWHYEERINNYKKILDFLNLNKNIVMRLLEDEIDLEEFEGYLNNALKNFYQLNTKYLIFNSKEIKKLFERYSKMVSFISKENDEKKICEEFMIIERQIEMQVKKELEKL